MISLGILDFSCILSDYLSPDFVDSLSVQRLKLLGDLQYLLNPKGTTPAEVMGIDYKSTITPALDSHTDEINKSSVVKLEEMIALQQKLKDHSTMMEKKRHQVEVLHSHVDEVSLSQITPYCTF